MIRLKPEEEFGMRLIRSSGMVLLTALLVAACGGGGSTPSGPVKTITIGANVEATGAAASIGSQWRDGVKLAISVLDGQGAFTVKGQQYKIVADIQDSAADPQQAITINQSFIRNNYPVLLGPGVSTVFGAAFPSIAGNDVVVLSPAATVGQYLSKPEGKYLFHTHIADDGTTGRVYKMTKAIVAKYSPTKAAVLLPQDPIGELYGSAYKTALSASNVSLVYDQRFPSAQRDFSSYIAAIKAAGPDIVFIPYLNTWAVPFLAQAIQVGYTSPIFVGSPGTSSSTIQGKTDQIKKFVWSVTTRATESSTDPQVADFRTRYKAFFGKDADANAFWTLSYYDEVLMLPKVLQQAGSVSDPKAITAAYKKVTTWPGKTLNLTFDSGNSAVYTPQLAFLESGNLTYQDAK
jgi:branched-chain amino acid transport system substrate-binding protein